MAKKRPVISVTMADILLGTPACSHSCPIAIALRRKLRLKRDDVQVGTGGINIKKDTERDFYGSNVCRYPTPDSASRFIEDFDDIHKTGSRGKVKPFKFALPMAREEQR